MLNKTILILSLIISALISRSQNTGQSDFAKGESLRAYIDKNDWEGFKKEISSASLKPLTSAQLYLSAANKISEKPDGNLAQAEIFAQQAVNIAKAEWANTPMTAEGKPKTPGIAWSVYYPRYIDAYANILFKAGKYQQALVHAREATFTHYKGKNPDYNTTYILVAEKIQPAKEYKKDAEQFIKDAKATPEIKEVLKRLYLKEKKTEAGFNEYIEGLQKNLYQQMLTDLRKSMISAKAPSFAIKDLNGNMVDMKALKGKILIVDFWASWCAPCKASFPAMQKVVNKYKDDPDVKFFFVDTWEKIKDKEKVAGDFIKKHQYSFQVLMDNEDKVVKQFNVSGLPTKFVIDKNGIIRFVSVDFKEHEDDKLVNELSAMIEVAREVSR